MALKELVEIYKDIESYPKEGSYEGLKTLAERAIKTATKIQENGFLPPTNLIKDLEHTLKQEVNSRFRLAKSLRIWQNPSEKVRYPISSAFLKEVDSHAC